MSIQILSDDVVNQIAAGEVVERPSHLVKELIENSLDAGATEIEIDFSHGGREVQISDNGKGMDAADLDLSIARHATSKILETKDLWALNTFGFRGEALASIAAVSNLKIQSRPKEALGGEIEVHFGKPVKKKSYEGTEGTKIFLTELFENLPARLKFLKSEAAEAGSIKTVVKSLAMSRPNVSFRVLQSGKLLFFWPKTDQLKNRVEQVLEKNQMYESFAEMDSYKARVILAPPNEIVNQNRQTWIFVNGRAVQDKNLQFAVLEAYRSFLMHGEYPIACVFLQCPPEELDVNIHPTKSQVKFRNSNLAFRVVHKAVRMFLEKAPWVSEMTRGTAVQTTVPSQSTSFESSRFQSGEFNRTQLNQKMDFPTMQQFQAARSEIGADHVFGTADSAANAFVATAANPAWANLMVLGQANQTYILTQNERSLIMVDQHAAHERVLFETLMLDWKEKRIEVQSLLIPMTVEIEEPQMEAIRSKLSDLNEIGLDISEMGPSTLAVRSMPALIKEESLQAVIEKLVEEVEQYGESFSLEKAMSEVFASMACHSAIRAGQALSKTEMTGLLNQMDEFPMSSFCPHGRPVFFEMNFSEIDRRFGRIV